MRYGKIRVEDGNLIFFRHMIQNNLPCRDIVWAYIHREGENAEEAVKQMISNYLVIITRRKKRYQFEMTEHEAQDCLRILKLFNPEMATGFPKGGRITMQSLSKRSWGNRHKGWASYPSQEAYSKRKSLSCFHG